ncbi:MAG: hypothetical protein A2Z99_15315 [Treponema sp. GWB1_62_6]|nr:MAG: hypothetical protein A2Y36_04055 [Treponema sp. GWA1_62_8]OHE68122.1 MAG: hypothetical protein A2Z99_15315 [Treponema sp. GWB1_62_6]OHE68681.1 MAG: hypothetical protein A2001_06030 [Treponema sp. GWC1_61_84]
MDAANFSIPDFSLLTPADVADAAEATLGVRVDGTLTPYPSYINRVYGLRTEDGDRVIAKFYRPGRWTERAIRAEHSFAFECAAALIPALVPMADSEGDTLGTVVVEDDDGGERAFFFALYPFITGRGWEPEDDEALIALGRIVGSLHAVGASAPAPDRREIHPERSTRPSLRRLVDGGFVHPEFRAEFEDACASALDAIGPLFEGVPYHRLHGDLHRGNVLSIPDASGIHAARPLLIDFDDMATGPAVQDLWLFLPGRLEDSRRELALLTEGYAEIRRFDFAQTALVEPLRFMRMLGYLDWQALQSADEGFLRAFPDWGCRAFWIKELEDLRDQAAVVRDAL